MKVYLLGAEQPTMLRLLHEANAVNVGMSFHSLFPRLPKKKEYLVAEKFDDRMNVYLASGGHTYSKKATSEQCVAFLEQFEMFVENNQGSLDLVTAYDGPLRPDVREGHYIRMRAMLGERFAPVWDPADGYGALETLAAWAKVIGLPAAEVKDNPGLAARLLPMHNRLGVQWHALDGARPDDLRTGRYASAATQGWLSPMKFGETIVWDGTRMVRYNKSMKDQARRRHRSTFTRAGFDAEAILGDDNQEISRFTVWSYMRLEEAVSTRKPPVTNPFTVIEGDLSTTPPGNEPGNELEVLPDDVDNTAVVTRNAPNLPTKREERQTLPSMAFTTAKSTEFNEDGEQVQVTRLLAKNSNVTLRQCDTCFVAATCPAFQPGAECAFELPVEIKTKDQLDSLLSTILEMQAQRVAFMRFAEEQNGGYADPNLSQEIDRFYTLVQKVKEIKDDAATFKLHVEAKAGAGVLSRILGEKAAKQLGNLDRPLDSAQAIHDVIDGDVIN